LQVWHAQTVAPVHRVLAIALASFAIRIACCRLFLTAEPQHSACTKGQKEHSADR
jgi:hypothetical protein